MEDDRKIVFIVPTVALVEQQMKQFQTYMSEEHHCHGMSGDQETLPLGELLSTNDVFVMTPQILLNALEQSQIDCMSSFSLIIFDECHHTIKDHPYNLIMSLYLDDILSAHREGHEASLPQVRNYQ